VDPSRHLELDGHAKTSCDHTGSLVSSFVECARPRAARRHCPSSLSPSSSSLQLRIRSPPPNKPPLSPRIASLEGRKEPRRRHDTGVPATEISRLPPPRPPAAAEQRFVPSPALRSCPPSPRRPVLVDRPPRLLLRFSANPLWLVVKSSGWRAACSWCRLVVRGIIFTVLDTDLMFILSTRFYTFRGYVASRSRNFLGGKKEEAALAPSTSRVWLLFHTPSINRSLFFY